MDKGKKKEKKKTGHKKKKKKKHNGCSPKHLLCLESHICLLLTTLGVGLSALFNVLTNKLKLR